MIMTQILNFCIISIFLTLFTIIQVRGVSNKQIQKSVDLVINKDINNPSEAINDCSAENSTTTNPNHKYITGKKWQVGKVSRKHYEIINMLWRKTNIFNDEGDEAVTEAIVSGSTGKNIKEKVAKRTKSSSPITFPNVGKPFGRFSQASTPSYIEFYYLDEAVDQSKRHIDQNTHTGKNIPPRKTALNDLKIYSRLPFFVFHVNEPVIAIKPPTTTVKKTTTNNVVSMTRSYTTPKLSTTTSQPTKNKLQNMPFHFHQLSLQYPVSKTLESNLDGRTINNLFNDSNSKTQKFPTSAFKDIKNTSLIFQTLGDNINKLVSTKVYDRIKFFEIYDSNTLEPNQNNHKAIDYEEDENQPDTNELDRDHKILLAHIDKDLQYTQEIPKKKYEKKHVKSYEFENITTAQIEEFEANLSVVTLNSSPSFSTENIVQRQQFFNESESIINSSKCASWSEYPFVAVYVYELYRIYCDAAIISPHWLMASGSCLSQNSVEHNENSRSAFVTYCGDTWWNPERITYVKSCSIHPRFNPHDNNRKYFYNIGLIQVISSMASACSNWSPASLMSHQFGTESDGSFALAVGWGLDRFITRPATDLPRTNLSVFEGKVFSNACPGNSIYKKLHFSNGEITNIYCLLLPPYTGEETDAVHGGLLVVGGKLFALYLQEERRHWGFQSAIYTGIWRLVPWIIRVAKEPEEADFFI